MELTKVVTRYHTDNNCVLTFVDDAEQYGVYFANGHKLSHRRTDNYTDYWLPGIPVTTLSLECYDIKGKRCLFERIKVRDFAERTEAYKHTMWSTLRAMDRDPDDYETFADDVIDYDSLLEYWYQQVRSRFQTALVKTGERLKEVKRFKEYLEKNPDAECPVLHTPITKDDLVLLKCNHSLCLEALKGIVEANKSEPCPPACPLCRANFSPLLIVCAEELIATVKAIDENKPICKKKIANSPTDDGVSESQTEHHS